MTKISNSRLKHLNSSLNALDLKNGKNRIERETIELLLVTGVQSAWYGGWLQKIYEHRAPESAGEALASPSGPQRANVS